MHIGGGNRFNICLTCFGGDGSRNTYLNCRSIRNGQEWRGVWSWETSSSSWTARQLETLGLRDEWYKPSRTEEDWFVRCGLKPAAAAWTGLLRRFACCRMLKPFEDILASDVTSLIFFGLLLDSPCWILTVDFDRWDCGPLSHWNMIQEERRFESILLMDSNCWALLLKVFFMCLSPTWYV